MLDKIFNRIRNYNNPQSTSVENTDNEITDVIKTLLVGSAKIIFDVGAHHGRYARSIKNKFPNAQIFCFEPYPEAFLKLKANLTTSNFHLRSIAVSNFTGNSEFYVNQLDETNSLLPAVRTNSALDELTFLRTIISVPVTTVDEISQKEGIEEIDLLKVDVQGNTMKVLEGARRLIGLKRVKVIQCEVEFIEIYQYQKLFHHITSYLESFGYSLYSIYNQHYDIDNRISWCDAIYFLE